MVQAERLGRLLDPARPCSRDAGDGIMMARAFLAGAKLGGVATLFVFGALAALGWLVDKAEAGEL